MPVEFESEKTQRAGGKDALVYSMAKVFAQYKMGQRVTGRRALEYDADRAIIAGIAQVCHAAGVFDRMSREAQEQFLADLVAVIFSGRNA